jgi:hypothetical protein
MVKEMPANAIESGSFLTFSFMVVLVTTDRGAFLVTGSFLVCCCTILSEALSNQKVFRLATLRALEGMNSPSPSSPSGKCPPMSGASVDDPECPCPWGKHHCLLLLHLASFVLPLFPLLLLLRLPSFLVVAFTVASAFALFLSLQLVALVVASSSF